MDSTNVRTFHVPTVKHLLLFRSFCFLLCLSDSFVAILLCNRDGTRLSFARPKLVYCHQNLDFSTWYIQSRVSRFSHTCCHTCVTGTHHGEVLDILFNEATLSESSLAKVDILFLAPSLAVEGGQSPHQHLQWGQSMPGSDTVLFHILLFPLWDSEHSAYSNLLVSGEGADYSTTSGWEQHQSPQPTVVHFLPWGPHHIVGWCPQTFGYR